MPKEIRPRETSQTWKKLESLSSMEDGKNIRKGTNNLEFASWAFKKSNVFFW